jgi:hypothetical protein
LQITATAIVPARQPSCIEGHVSELAFGWSKKQADFVLSYRIIVQLIWRLEKIIGVTCRRPQLALRIGIEVTISDRGTVAYEYIKQKHIDLV